MEVVVHVHTGRLGQSVDNHISVLVGYYVMPVRMSNSSPFLISPDIHKMNPIFITFTRDFFPKRGLIVGRDLMAAKNNCFIYSGVYLSEKY